MCVRRHVRRLCRRTCRRHHFAVDPQHHFAPSLVVPWGKGIGADDEMHQASITLPATCSFGLYSFVNETGVDTVLHSITLLLHLWHLGARWRRSRRCSAAPEQDPIAVSLLEQSNNQSRSHRSRAESAESLNKGCESFRAVRCHRLVGFPRQHLLPHHRELAPDSGMWSGLCALPPRPPAARRRAEADQIVVDLRATDVPDIRQRPRAGAAALPLVVPPQLVDLVHA